MNKFVILACPRTGTNHYISMLNSSQSILCHSEIFHKKSVFLKDGEYPDLMSERDKNPIEFLEKVYAKNQKEKSAIGFKIFIDHCDDVVNYCIDSPDIKCIVLYRNNFLAAYSSNLIAAKSNQWVKSVNDSKEKVKVSVEFDAKDFIFHYKRYQDYYKNIINRLNKLNKKFLFIQYSDLQSQELVSQTFSFLDVPVPDSLGGWVEKINSSNIISRFNNSQKVFEFLESVNLQDWAYESFLNFTSRID